LEVVSVDRERDNQDIVLFVVEVVPLFRANCFQPPPKKSAQRSPANLTAAGNIIAVLNNLVLRRMKEKIVGQKRAETMGEDDIGSVLFNLRGQMLAQMFPELLVFSELRDHSDLPFDRLVHLLAKAASPAKEP
jgi:hypothetical protein